MKISKRFPQPCILAQMLQYGGGGGGGGVEGPAFSVIDLRYLTFLIATLLFIGVYRYMTLS